MKKIIVDPTTEALNEAAVALKAIDLRKIEARTARDAIKDARDYVSLAQKQVRVG